jgi:membrane protein required for colicin V production
MNSLDTVIIIIMLFCLLYGFFKGFFSEIIAIIGLVISIVVAGRYYHLLAPHILVFLQIEALAGFASFVLILFAGMFAFGLLRLVIKKTTVEMELGWADHLLGILLGFIKGLLISSVIVLMILAIWGSEVKVIRSSRLAPTITRISQITANLLPDKIKNSSLGKIMKDKN